MFQGRLLGFVHPSSDVVYSSSVEFFNFSLKHTCKKVVIKKMFHFSQIQNLRCHSCLFRETFNIFYSF